MKCTQKTPLLSLLSQLSYVCPEPVLGKLMVLKRYQWLTKAVFRMMQMRFLMDYSKIEQRCLGSPAYAELASIHTYLTTYSAFNMS